MSHQLAPTTTGQCATCGGIGTHQRGCDHGKLRGHGVGQRRPSRTISDRQRWARAKAETVRRQAGKCAWCDQPWVAPHPHHVETVQQVFARGGTWAHADTSSNCRIVCAECHDEIHAGINRDTAIARGFLLP
ncbi:MAG: hypothetical protein AAF567_24380 [Actinomycetota bacterium]